MGTKYLLILVLAVTWSATCGSADADNDSRKKLAERFFRGIYACEPSVVDELASEDVILSYPIFEKLFGTLAISGQEAVREFAVGFCGRWEDPQITIHEAIAEGDRVVLVWSFEAKNVGSADPERPPTNEVHSWGGISIYLFDKSGKVKAEIGEESAPGPAARTGLGKTAH